jgi:hypothetical protein
MKKIPVVFVVFFLVLPGIFTTKHALAATKFPLTVKLVWSSVYDDNILKYSPRDLDRFENNTESYPSEVTTTDDWINTFGLRLYHTFKLNRSFRFRPYYSGRLSLYSVNNIKNVQYHYLMARFDYRYRIYLYLQYSYMPGYYLRVYKDRDLNEYHGCEYDMSRPAVRIRYRLKSLSIEGMLAREYSYYNEYFTEYDAEANLWGLTGSYDLPVGLDVSLGYVYKNSDNIGFNQVTITTPDPTEEDTEYGDSSYEEDHYRFSLDYALPVENEWGWSIGFDYKRYNRYYQSQLPYELDKFHTGRKDRRDVIEPHVSFSPSSNVDLEFGFTYDQRRTESIDPIVASIKNYIRRTYRVTMVYQIF